MTEKKKSRMTEKKKSGMTEKKKSGMTEKESGMTGAASCPDLSPRAKTRPLVTPGGDPGSISLACSGSRIKSGMTQKEIRDD
jgi:hypothetical protein